MIRPVILIPHFEHVEQLERLLRPVLILGLPVMIVDDGSNREAYDRLQGSVQALREDQLTLHRLPRNRGKGAAVMTGFTLAAMAGYTHAVQIDADGQHDLNDVGKMLEISRAEPGAIVSGLPQFGDDMPTARRLGKKFGHIWTVLETLSFRIKDGMCGFRVYPLAVMEAVVDGFHIGARMNFDIEILVKSDWIGIPIVYVPTEVAYPEDGKSHFHYFRDNVDIVIMHIRLLVGMLPRAGKLLYRTLSELFR